MSNLLINEETKEIITNWQKSLRIIPISHPSFNHPAFKNDDYKLSNIGTESIKVVTVDENYICINPENYVIMSRADVVATLTAYNGRCSNSYLLNNNVIVCELLAGE